MFKDPEWQLPGNPCLHCGIRILDIDHHNEPCDKSPSCRHMLVMPPNVDDIYMVGIVPDEAPF